MKIKKFNEYVINEHKNTTPPKNFGVVSIAAKKYVSSMIELAHIDNITTESALLRGFYAGATSEAAKEFWTKNN